MAGDWSLLMTNTAHNDESKNENRAALKQLLGILAAFLAVSAIVLPLVLALY